MKQFSRITTLSTTKRNAKIMPHADSDRKLVVVNDISVVVPITPPVNANLKDTCNKLMNELTLSYINVGFSSTGFCLFNLRAQFFCEI